MDHVWFRARGLLATFAVVLACLMAAACSDSGSDDPPAMPTFPEQRPTPTYEGPGEQYTIQSTTQLHLDGVGIGTGNIWEEEYTPAGGTPQRGLTAMLAISVESDPTYSQTLRVHPGLELDIPGYHLQVLAVDEGYVHLAVTEGAD